MDTYTARVTNNELHCTWSLRVVSDPMQPRPNAVQTKGAGAVEIILLPRVLETGELFKRLPWLSHAVS